MKVSIFERYAQDSWDYYIKKMNRNDTGFDQWKKDNVKRIVTNTREASVKRKYEFVEEKDQHNSLKLLSDYYLLILNRRNISLNAQMNKDFYKLGRYIDVKV